jgi:hypothetical protein
MAFYFHNSSNQLKLAMSAPVFLLFIFFLSLHNLSLHATNDSTQVKKQKFDLNDPRNPDCPCHKYQKLADEEYARKSKHSPIITKMTMEHQTKKQVQSKTDYDQKEMEIAIKNNEADLATKQTAELSQNEMIDNKEINSRFSKSKTAKRTIRNQDPISGPSLKNYHKRNGFWIKLKFHLFRLNKKLITSHPHPDYKVCFKWH